MNDFFSNKLRLLKFILLSIALGNFFIAEFNLQMQQNSD